LWDHPRKSLIWSCCGRLIFEPLVGCNHICEHLSDWLIQEKNAICFSFVASPNPPVWNRSWGWEGEAVVCAWAWARAGWLIQHRGQKAAKCNLYHMQGNITV
jgi:hypothetical protein